MKSVIIVDVQNDFCKNGSLATEKGHEVAKLITDYVATLGNVLVVASRDWHNPDSRNGDHFSDNPDFVNTWPAHCVAKTKGADYHPDLKTENIDVEIFKGQNKPAYSAFEGCTQNGETLKEILVKHNVTEVEVVGIALDYCVKATALDAKKEGFNVNVIKNLTAAVNEQTGEETVQMLKQKGVAVTFFKEIRKINLIRPATIFNAILK